LKLLGFHQTFEQMPSETDSTIRQIEFELEKAEHGMAFPYDPERVGQLRHMLVEARKRKLSHALATKRRRGLGQALVGIKTGD
jgi:hypothetical protein